MSNSRYSGVYSEYSAGTDIGTDIDFQPKGIFNITSKSKPRQYQSIDQKTLEKANLNVAKLRLVSTLPGKEVPSEMKGKAYVGFILTGVQESHSEKVEIIPLPGDSFASYFYGANPRQYAFTGILLNTEQDQWRDSFEHIYEKYLRGSTSSRDFSIVQVSYNGRIVSGWLTNLSQQLDSSNDHYASFSFNVLVSRVDMVGGSKNFSDYLVTLPADGGEFANANIDKDYAVLDPTNYNAMIDPIRTGMVVPPKRPHRSRKKKSPSCFFPAVSDDDGTAINSGAATNNTHINDSTICTVTELISNSQKMILEARNKAAELAKKAANAPTSDKAKALLAKAEEQSLLASKLESGLKQGRSREDVKQQLEAEKQGALDHVLKTSREVDTNGKPTTRAIQAQKALTNTVISMEGATLTVDTDQDGNYIVADYFNDLNVYDGTDRTEDVRTDAQKVLTRNTIKQDMGLFDKANSSIREKQEAEKKKKQDERNKKAKNNIIARIRFK